MSFKDEFKWTWQELAKDPECCTKELYLHLFGLFYRADGEIERLNQALTEKNKVIDSFLRSQERL